MKRILFVMLLALMSVIGMAQPQGFSYQTIVRDNSGNAITNTQVKFRFTISQNSTAVYVETDTVTTNDFGLVNLVIGQGQVESGDFSAIDWSGSICSLQVDLDLQDGGGYHNMGTSNFTSVPYAQYAGSTASSVAGHEGELQFNKNNSLGSNALLNWNDTLGALGIGTHADTGRLVIQAASDAIDSLPLFQVKDKNGQTVFAVYNNSVHVFVDKEAKKRSYGAYKGGFVISGKNSGAQKANDIMVVNADSTRVFTQDEKAGFGVVGVSAKRGTSSPYMHINPDNYFIGTNSGENVTTGTYNSTFGYETGKALTTGEANNFVGYHAGYSNTTGYNNNFIGAYAGTNNDSGYYNNFIGAYTGNHNISGFDNNFLGTYAGYNNTTGYSNNFLGDHAGYYNIDGYENNFIGDGTGFSNTIGYANNFLGANAGWQNDSGYYNNFIGYYAGSYNTSGYANNFIGNYAGYSNTIGHSNNFIGDLAGYLNTTGSYNNFIGTRAGYYIEKGDENIAIGYHAGPSVLGTYNNRLYINNDTSDFPLIYGEFDNKIVAVNGKMGIGTKTPDKELTVIGDIRVTGNFYYGTGSDTLKKPDFVFAPTYRKQYDILKIERYLKRHKHLPWVTAAKDEKGGINMTRMSFETLEAVENQQLQIIELKKENNQIRKENKLLKKQNQEILKRLEKLEKKFKK